MNSAMTLRGASTSTPPDFRGTAIGVVVAATLVAAFVGRGASIRSDGTDAAATPPSAFVSSATPASLIDHSVVRSIDIGTEPELVGASVAAYER